MSRSSSSHPRQAHRMPPGPSGDGVPEFHPDELYVRRGSCCCTVDQAIDVLVVIHLNRRVKLRSVSAPAVSLESSEKRRINTSASASRRDACSLAHCARRRSHLDEPARSSGVATATGTQCKSGSGGSSSKLSSSGGAISQKAGRWITATQTTGSPSLSAARNRGRKFGRGLQRNAPLRVPVGC